MDEAVLSVCNLTVQFDRHMVLEDVSFEVKKDETLAIIGPNGAGKTVLFRALLGLIPYQGEIVWANGVKIGYVPQKVAVESDFPLTVKEFFELKEKVGEKVGHALETVGFGKEEKIADSRLGVLSGGQLQRVLIAFALLGHPDVLLFDEPTSGVDVSAEETIYALLRKVQEKENLTLLLISHELQIIYRFAKNVLCLNKEKICFGPPREALDKEGLAKLYGEEVGLYDHH